MLMKKRCTHNNIIIIGFNLTNINWCIHKICGTVMELVTLNAPNDIDIINNSGESDEEDRQKSELETVVYENSFHDIGKFNSS